MTLMSLLLFLLCACCCFPLLAAGRTHIILDVDGSVDDYASLTTIVENSIFRSQLSLITVSGLTWGHAATVARNICRFLSLSQLRDVHLSIGALQARADEYSTISSRGGCSHSQGFPSTPEDATRRGMKYSRADVTSCFGAAYSLPIKSCSVQVNASKAFHSLIRDLSGSDNVVYLGMASTTNLAVALDYLGRHDPESLQRFKEAAVVHLFEKGYNFAVDSVSTVQVLAESGLRCVLYLPTFYDPAVTFSFSSWSEFSTLAKGTGASKIVAWLFSAWEAKKTLIELHSNDPLTSFFGERGPASSLVTLCALDSTVRSSCILYQTALSNVSFHLEKPSESGPGSVTHRITGNNVTWPSYLLATAGNGVSDTRFLVERAANSFPPSSTTSLASAFWSVWLHLLRS